MKKFILTIIFFILSSNVFSANEELKNKIYKNIRCIVCQGQSIYESNSDFAIDLKKLISKKLDNGENEKQIYSDVQFGLSLNFGCLSKIFSNGNYLRISLYMNEWQINDSKTDIDIKSI